MLVYSIMYYDYEQTDISLATVNLKDVLEYDMSDYESVFVWKDRKSVRVYYDKESKSWESWVSVDVLDLTEIDIFNEFKKELLNY